MSRRLRRRRPHRPRTTPGSGGSPTWSVAALRSPGPPILGPRPAPRPVSRLGQPPSPRRGRRSTSRAPTGREGAKERRAHGVPRVPARGPAAEPRRPWRPTPTGTDIRRPMMTGPGVRPTCDNMPSQPHPVGGKASQTVSPGSPVGEYPPRKETPESTHARRRPGEDAPSDKHELCDRKFTCPRRGPRGDTHASPSYPVRSPQTLRKPPSDILQGPSEDPPLRAHRASLSGGRPKLRTPP